AGAPAPNATRPRSGSLRGLARSGRPWRRSVRSAGGGDAGARRDDRLQLDVVVHTLGAKLAADARALEATERRHEVHVVLIHRVGAGAHASGDVHALVDVGRPHRAGEAVLTVVGDPRSE